MPAEFYNKVLYPYERLNTVNWINAPDIQSILIFLGNIAAALVNGDDYVDSGMPLSQFPS